MVNPKHKNSCPGGMEIYSFSRPFFGHHYHIISLFDPCQRVEKNILNEIMHFHFITHMEMSQIPVINICSALMANEQ